MLTQPPPTAASRAARRVLMLAYHFPPLAGSSGIQRTLRFVQHLPRFGWQPLVLTADPRAYERTSGDLLAEVPAGTVVRRAFALDTARHLAIGGRHIGAMARPDRWISWKYDALRQGMEMIERYQPQVIWSTYPIATAHLIGAELQRRSGLPWVADFRDPMAQDGYPSDPKTWRQYKAIEELALGQAALSTFTTPGAARMYHERYPAAASRIEVLENGYDEESFVAAERDASTRAPLAAGALTLLHSGIVYPEERDPSQLFAALGQLQQSGELQTGQLKIRFRAAVHDDLLRGLAGAHGVESFIELHPPIGYRDALHEMLHADALLVLQAANCNAQIPAKLYEYLRANRPIACLSDPAGDTVGVLRAAGLDTFARLDDDAGIAELLRRLLTNHRTGQLPLPDPDYVRHASRSARAAQLAAALSCVARPATRAAQA